MFNIQSRGFWLRFIPVVVVIFVDVFFLVFLDNYFFIKKRAVIVDSQQEFRQLQKQLTFIKDALGKIPKTDTYTVRAKDFLESKAKIALEGEGPWVRITLTDQEGDVVFREENLVKLSEFNNWKNSLFSQSFIAQVGIAELQLLIEFATPPGFNVIEELAWRYKLYALLFVIGSWMAFFFLERKVVHPLIKVDQGIERIIRTGNVALISNPNNETEIAFNQLMRTQREVFFSLEVDHTVDHLHHISDEKEVIPRFLQESAAAIQKIYSVQSAAAMLYQNKEWTALHESTPLVEIPDWTDGTIYHFEQKRLVIYIVNDEKPVGALCCEWSETEMLPKEEAKMALEIKKQVEQGIARCIGRSRHLTEERNRFGINIATNMGHDLTNIIASGKWDLDTISRAQKLGIVQTDEQRGKYYTESVDGLRNNLHFLQEMVDIYRSFAHTQKPRFENADLTFLIHDLVQLFTRSTSKKITVTVDTPEKLEAFVEPRLLRMTLFNLLNNAAQAIVQSDPPVQDGNIRVAVKQSEDHDVSFEIHDNGPGIRDPEGVLLSEQQIPRIFQSGYSTKGKSSGGGLGLSWVRSIIEDFHQGSISARNHAEGGALFTFSIPIQKQEIPHEPL